MRRGNGGRYAPGNITWSRQLNLISSINASVERFRRFSSGALFSLERFRWFSSWVLFSWELRQGLARDYLLDTWESNNSVIWQSDHGHILVSLRDQIGNSATMRVSVEQSNHDISRNSQNLLPLLASLIVAVTEVATNSKENVVVVTRGAPWSLKLGWLYDTED